MPRRRRRCRPRVAVRRHVRSEDRVVACAEPCGSFALRRGSRRARARAHRFASWPGEPPPRAAMRTSPSVREALPAAFRSRAARFRSRARRPRRPSWSSPCRVPRRAATRGGAWHSSQLGVAVSPRHRERAGSPPAPPPMYRVRAGRMRTASRAPRRCPARAASSGADRAGRFRRARGARFSSARSPTAPPSRPRASGAEEAPPSPAKAPRATSRVGNSYDRPERSDWSRRSQPRPRSPVLRRAARAPAPTERRALRPDRPSEAHRPASIPPNHSSKPASNAGVCRSKKTLSPSWPRIPRRKRKSEPPQCRAGS